MDGSKVDLHNQEYNQLNLLNSLNSVLTVVGFNPSIVQRIKTKTNSSKFSNLRKVFHNKSFKNLLQLLNKTRSKFNPKEMCKRA